MAPPTVRTLQRLAAETGYRLDTLEKVLRLLELLDEIAQDPVLSQRLALKGGTALNVSYLDLDRLSVDIDLNYVGALDLAALERERPEVDAAIDRLFASQGYGVRRRPTGHAGGKWLARYASALGGNASLELDLNYMARQPLFGAARMESRILGRVGRGRVLVFDLHEVVAGKIVALFDRRAARDLFDVRRILAIEGLDRSWIKAAVLALGACNRRDWRGVSKDAIGCDSREFRRNLAICLPRDLFGNAGDVDTWIAQSVELCREGLAFRLELSENERSFLDGVLDRGEVNANLLGVEREAGVAPLPCAYTDGSEPAELLTDGAAAGRRCSGAASNIVPFPNRGCRHHRDGRTEFRFRSVQRKGFTHTSTTCSSQHRVERRTSQSSPRGVSSP